MLTVTPKSSRMFSNFIFIDFNSSISNCSETALSAIFKPILAKIVATRTKTVDRIPQLHFVNSTDF